MPKSVTEIVTEIVTESHGESRRVTEIWLFNRDGVAYSVGECKVYWNM